MKISHDIDGVWKPKCELLAALMVEKLKVSIFYTKKIEYLHQRLSKIIHACVLYYAKWYCAAVCCAYL